MIVEFLYIIGFLIPIGLFLAIKFIPSENVENTQLVEESREKQVVKEDSPASKIVSPPVAEKDSRIKIILDIPSEIMVSISSEDLLKYIVSKKLLKEDHKPEKEIEEEPEEEGESEDEEEHEEEEDLSDLVNKGLVK